MSSRSSRCASGWQPDLPAFLYLGAVGVALAMIDIDLKRLPNVLVLPSYLVAGVLLGAAALVDGRAARPAAGRPSEWRRCTASTSCSRSIYPAGMGFGDVKLAGVLGIYLGWLGWGELVVGAFLGFLFGGVVGLLLMAVRRAGRKSSIPFGPYMLAGALVSILWGGALADLYLDNVLG